MCSVVTGPSYIMEVWRTVFANVFKKPHPHLWGMCAGLVSSNCKKTIANDFCLISRGSAFAYTQANGQKNTLKCFPSCISPNAEYREKTWETRDKKEEGAVGTRSVNLRRTRCVCFQLNRSPFGDLMVVFGKRCSCEIVLQKTKEAAVVKVVAGS